MEVFIRQKDARIAELETNLRETIDMVKNSNYKEVLEENISLSNSLNSSVELNRKHREHRAELEKQLAIRDKALKYACKYYSFKTGGYPEPIFFLEQAERASRRNTEKIGGEQKW